MRNTADTLTDRALELARLTVIRRIITAVAVVASALLQTFLIQAFVNPANLLPSGFTGIAVLIDRITSLGGIHISTDIGMLALNIPLVFICWSRISKRFVIFSMLQVALSALFLRVLDFQPLLDDQIMLVVFGGFISGISIAVALKAGASTGGTDFISLLVANETGKTIWGFIFAGGCGSSWCSARSSAGRTRRTRSSSRSSRQDDRQLLPPLRPRHTADHRPGTPTR